MQIIYSGADLLQSFALSSTSGSSIPTCRMPSDQFQRSAIHPTAQKRVKTPQLPAAAVQDLAAQKEGKVTDPWSNKLREEADRGITDEELLQSCADQLTEAAAKLSIKSGTIGDKDARNGKVLQPSDAPHRLSVWIHHCFSLYGMFRVYLKHMATVFVTAIVILLACSIRGDIILFAILTYKAYRGEATGRETIQNAVISIKNITGKLANHSMSQAVEQNGSIPSQILPDYLQLPASYNLTDLLFYVVIGIVVSEFMYHILCGFLQLYYYEMQRDDPEKWKCQPHRFLTRSNEMHEVIVGTTNLVLAGGLSGFLSCWIVNGNYSTVYFRPDEYGYPYLLFSVVWVFVWLEASAYYSHLLLHTPWFYKNIHKHHHRYHSPTAYSVVAMSPFEMLFYEVLFISPLFLFPVHGLVYVAEVVYVYYFGLMDHSGIKMESWFPWQPDSMFHDNHHRYFHCNFGFNASWFDKLHGTMRRSDRLYGENVFWGKGAELKQE